MCGLTALCLVLMEVSGQNTSFDKAPLQSLVTLLGPLVVWYMGIYARRTAQKGSLTFKEGVSEGFKISLVYGLVSPFIFLVYYLVVNPGIVSYVRQAYGMAGAPDSSVIMVDMLVQLIAALVFGLVYSAVIALILRSKKPTPVQSSKSPKAKAKKKK